MSRRSLSMSAVAVLVALQMTFAPWFQVAGAWALDVTPPVIVVQGVSDGVVYGAAIAPQATCSDPDLATLQLTLDGATWSSGSIIGQGRHTIVAVATDTSANTTRTSVSFTVDVLEPILYFLVPSPEVIDVGVSDQEVVYLIELGDDLSGIDMARSGMELRSPNGVLAEAVTPLTLVSGDPAGGRGNFTQTFRIPKGSEPGIWVPAVAFYDLAGHPHGVNNSCDLLGFGGGKNVTVGSTAVPVDRVHAAIVSAAPNPAAGGTPVMLTAVANDSLGHAITGYEWSSDIDGVLGTSSTAAFTTAALSAGTHRISVRARCSEGTWSDAAPFQDAVVVSAARQDTMAPMTSSDAVASYIGSATITLDPMDLYGSGVASTYYSLDGAPRVEGTVVTTPIAGRHTLTFWSVDRAGNAESPTALEFTVASPLVRATVSAPVAASTVRRGASFGVYGYVSPAHASGTYLVSLRFYKKNSAGRYVYHHTVMAKRYYYSSTKSTYKAYTSLTSRGKWRVRAFHSCSEHAGSYSGYDYIAVE